MQLKNITFSFILILVTFLCLEIVAFIAFYISEEEVFSFQENELHRKSVIEKTELFSNEPDANVSPEDAAALKYLNQYVLHPYLGYVWNPEHTELGKNAVNWFINTNSSPYDNQEEKVHVVVTGGSVAYYWARDNTQRIQDVLSEIASYKNKEIAVHNIAIYGYKQPQQLLSVLYFLLMGGKIDILINLDGVNEINAEPRGYINPSYPELWSYLNVRQDKYEKLEARYNILKSRRLRNSLAKISESLNFSVTINVLWHFYDKYLSAKISEMEEGERVYDKFNLPEHAKGPPFNFKPISNAYRYSHKLWKQSSIMTNSLANDNGFYYFHFLQPNQYVPNSKNFFTDEEKEFALSEFEEMRERVEIWYPEYIKTGEEIAQSGVNFYDLTNVYKNINETIYVDNCCHVNKLGNKILFENMIDKILKVIKDKNSKN